MMFHQIGQRLHPRYDIPLEGILHSRGEALPCSIRNISVGGALIQTEANLRPGHAIDVEIPEIGKMAGRVVRIGWNFAGVSLKNDEAKMDAFIVDRLERERKNARSP